MKVPTDCREIEPACSYLNLGNEKHVIGDRVKLILCDHHHVPLNFVLTKIEGSIQKNISSIRILYTCPHLQELRQKGLAPKVQGSISPNDKKRKN